jgi:hypothetical protein
VNNQECTIALFKGKTADRLVWQPRLHHWYEVNKARGTLPRQYEGWDLLKIYDDLRASPRAYHYFNNTIRAIEGENVAVETKIDENFIFTKYVTPKGTLTQTERRTECGTASLRTEYFLKGVVDFDVLAYVLKHQTFEFDKVLYEDMEKLLGDRSEPLITVPWGSIQRFFIVYMGYQNGVLSLWKHQNKVEELLRVFDENDAERFKLLRKTPFRIINFGDNIDEGLCSPPIFARYMLPYYQLRTKELHQSGKFCTSHWDGKVKRLLPFIKETGLDGVECVPPLPMGNVTIEELKEALGDKVLIDGIPAIYFLSLVSDEELEVFVHRLLEVFRSRIIAGISDMLPPDGNIEKVRKVSEIIANY